MFVAFRAHLAIVAVIGIVVAAVIGAGLLKKILATIGAVAAAMLALQAWQGG